MEIQLNYIHLLLLLVPVIILYRFLMYKIYDQLERWYVSLIYWGLYFYGGIGASAKTVSLTYTIYLLIFLTVFVFCYRLRYAIPAMVRHEVRSEFYLKNRNFFSQRVSAPIFIGLYLLVSFVPLLYPKFNLISLVNPPAPNVVEAFRKTVDTGTQEMDALSKIIYYLQLLLLPFFYVSLYRFTKKPWILLLLLCLPLYFTYCATNYVGRGMVLMALMLWFCVVYYFNKKWRKPLVLGSIFILPVLLIFFFVYSIARVGGDTEDAGTMSAIIAQLFYSEINFPESFADVVKSGQHVNFSGFIVWLVTLPVPKFLVPGSLNVPMINFELSEIVLGTSRYEDYFWVKLTGYISESYYVFGKYFFWVEAVMVAWLAKLLFYMLRAIKQSEVLILYVAIQFCFMFSRAGLGAVMPAFLNGFLALYAYILLKIYIAKRSAHSITLPQTST